MVSKKRRSPPKPNALTRLLRERREGWKPTKRRQADVAEAIGKTEHYVALVENGYIQRPPDEVLWPWVRYLEIPLEEVVEAVGWYADDEGRVSVDNSSFALPTGKQERSADDAADNPDVAFWLDVRERVTPGEYEALMALAREIMQRSA